MTGLEIQTPSWMEPMFRHHYRYIAIHGGRASGKSHAIAEYIVERSVMGKCDILCAREFQKSLQFSVKKLIESKIAKLNVGHMFDIQRDCIKSIYGGIIVFIGLSEATSESIKSFEAFDILWYEEAQVCSQRSLDMIRPTIRKPESQVIFTWNPRFETDPIDIFFRGGELPPNSLLLEVNYTDNPWFPGEMREEMEYDKTRDIDKYNHVWLGQYVKNTESRIFKHWRIEDFEAPRGTSFKLGADFGFGDATVLVRCFLEGRKLYIDHEAYMRGCEVHDTPTLFMTVPDAEKWPIVADSSRPETISYLRSHGFPAMMAAVKGPRSVEEGLSWLKSHDIIVHPRCQHVIEELTLYKYKENKQTGEIYPVPEDKNNHCIAEGVLISCERGEIPIEHVTTNDRVLTRGGYRNVLFSNITDVNRKILRVETTGGVVFCTPDHEVWTVKGFVRADALSYNDEIITLEESSCQQSKQQCTLDKRLDVTQRAKDEATGFILKNLLQEGVSGSTGRFGSSISDKFQQAITFIIKMATHSTTTSPTWSASARKSTWAIGTSGLMIEERRKRSILKEYATSPRHGTPAKKGELSTKKLGLLLTNISSQLKNSVEAAALHFYPRKMGILTCSAPINAKQPPEGSLASMTSSAHALSAQTLLPLTSMPTPLLVPGRVLTVTEHGVSERVYDLTVEEHHEFFANKVLVSNCIDAIRYGCEGARRARKVDEARSKHRGFTPIPCYSPFARK